MITGDKFISLAGKLASGVRPDEVTIRTAISRAYYGAFHVAKDFVLSLHVNPGRNHGELQRILSESGHAQVREAGKVLVELHRFRIKADYDLANERVNQPQLARDCVEMATDIRSYLSAVNTASELQSVKSGIQDYLRRIGRA